MRELKEKFNIIERNLKMRKIISAFFSRRLMILISMYRELVCAFKLF